jgi:hypothetical protein
LHAPVSDAVKPTVGSLNEPTVRSVAIAACEIDKNGIAGPVGIDGKYIPKSAGAAIEVFSV